MIQLHGQQDKVTGGLYEENRGRNLDTTLLKESCCGIVQGLWWISGDSTTFLEMAL